MTWNRIVIPNSAKDVWTVKHPHLDQPHTLTFLLFQDQDLDHPLKFHAEKPVLISKLISPNIEKEINSIFPPICYFYMQ